MPLLPRPITKIIGARLPCKPSDSLWDISTGDGRITVVDPHAQNATVVHDNGIIDAKGALLAPSLCHAHIHLDKCFVLQDPEFDDLQIETGDFKEAMEITKAAKARFSEQNLLRRMRRLVRESIEYGVTAMRAFVEVDGQVELRCLDAGLRVKKEFEDICEIQICAFAQEPLFSGPDAEINSKLMSQAAKHPDVEVVGSAPYVEDETNLDDHLHWMIDLAMTEGKRLDFHSDYFLDQSKSPHVHNLSKALKSKRWSSPEPILLGHCTRLTHFSESEWSQLKEGLDFPVTFVGLPTSDLYMMRSDAGVRGTLNILKLAQHGFSTAIGVNNIGNAFTPQGTCDPLSVASLGVAIYHAGSKEDANVLYDCVSTNAKSAIGVDALSRKFQVGEPADFVLFADNGWRTCTTIMQAVYDGGTHRIVIKAGKLVEIHEQVE